MAGLDGRWIVILTLLFSLAHVPVYTVLLELEVRFCDSHCDAVVPL